MNRYYLFAIPILIGIITGVFLSFFNNEENDSILTTKDLIENGSPILGNSFAPITILEWGDYQCTFCYRFHESSLNIILEEYVNPGKVKLVFKDFPLNGPDSILAAEAAHCAEDQGKYWEYHDELYNNWGGERTGWITRDSLNEFALNVDLEINEFNSCFGGFELTDDELAQVRPELENYLNAVDKMRELDLSSQLSSRLLRAREGEEA